MFFEFLSEAFELLALSFESLAMICCVTEFFAVSLEFFFVLFEFQSEAFELIDVSFEFLAMFCCVTFLNFEFLFEFLSFSLSL